MFQLVPWRTSYDVYRRIETIVNHQTGTLSCDSSESDKLSDVITDFSSLTQTLATISPLFFDQGLWFLFSKFAVFFMEN